MYRFFVAITFVLTTNPLAAGQSYDLSWNTIDGGGAMSATGGNFELAGTIGQPDAGSFAPPLTGGNFELIGGFWPAASATPSIPGDLDGDCDVDIADLAATLSVYGCCVSQTCYLPVADINADGCIDLTDLTGLLSNFGTTCN
jgi:hypothetical protein